MLIRIRECEGSDMSFDRTVCVIVDAYSTGKKLAPYLNGRGYSCVHIKSDPHLPLRFEHKASHFVKSIVFQGDINKVLEELRDYKVKICIPGSESGVELADTLSQVLNVPTNGTEYSRARRDKYIMTEMVAKKGLKTVKHIQSSHSQDIINWVKEQAALPIVLKPLGSASGDGVFFCHHENEIVSAFNSIIGKPNLFGQVNETVLAQTFSLGQEYIVNSVSCNGKHLVVEIWKIKKIENTTIYDTAEVMHRQANEFNALEAYTKEVLDALHIKHGASTTELKYTAASGPILIETGARLMGNAPLSFTNDLIGCTQLSLMVEAYLNPGLFMSLLDSKYQPEMPYHAFAVVLISDSEGVMVNKLNTEEIKNLPSFHSYLIDDEPGTKIQRTTSSVNSPGEIYLLNKDRNQLLEDCHRIRQIEKVGLYRNAIKDSKESIIPNYQAVGLLRGPIPITKNLAIPSDNNVLSGDHLIQAHQHENLLQTSLPSFDQ
jgi:biotin carboxylase